MRASLQTCYSELNQYHHSCIAHQRKLKLKLILLPIQPPANSVALYDTKRVRSGTPIFQFLACRSKRSVCEVSRRKNITWCRVSNILMFRYQHKITGIHTEDRPFEEGGGILADDMGMGKTLTTLALIEATSAEATSWASQPPRTETDYHRELPRIKSTLIIVPSTCKLSFCPLRQYVTDMNN